MLVKSIDVGDVFLSVTGNRWTITEIGCVFDEDEGRWETSIRYDLFEAQTGVSYQITEKARLVVQGLNTDVFYSQVHASGKVTQSNVIKPTGNSNLQNDFLANAVKYGLSPSDLGRTALLGGSKYQVVGAKPRNHTRPIIMEGSNGGLKKFPADEVKAGLEAFSSRKLQVK